MMLRLITENGGVVQLRTCRLAKENPLMVLIMPFNAAEKANASRNLTDEQRAKLRKSSKNI